MADGNGSAQRVDLQRVGYRSSQKAVADSVRAQITRVLIGGFYSADDGTDGRIFGYLDLPINGLVSLSLFFSFFYLISFVYCRLVIKKKRGRNRYYLRLTVNQGLVNRTEQ